MILTVEHVQNTLGTMSSKALKALAKELDIEGRSKATTNVALIALLLTNPKGRKVHYEMEMAQWAAETINENLLNGQGHFFLESPVLEEVNIVDKTYTDLRELADLKHRQEDAERRYEFDLMRHRQRVLALKNHIQNNREAVNALWDVVWKTENNGFRLTMKRKQAA